MLLFRQEGRGSEAIDAYRQAIDGGDDDALVNLGVLLAAGGVPASEVVLFYRAAVSAGHPRAWFILATMLSAVEGVDLTDDARALLTELWERGPEAEQEYRDEIAAGDDVAWFALGMLLAPQPGREGEAESCFREAVQAGMIEGLPMAAMVLAGQSGRKREAEQALRLAAVGGFGEAWLMVGALLGDQPTRGADADDAYRNALEAGHETAWCGLALLLELHGRPQEARAAHAKCPLVLDR